MLNIKGVELTEEEFELFERFERNRSDYAKEDIESFLSLLRTTPYEVDEQGRFVGNTMLTRAGQEAFWQYIKLNNHSLAYTKAEVDAWLQRCRVAYREHRVMGPDPDTYLLELNLGRYKVDEPTKKEKKRGWFGMGGKK